MPRGSRSSGGRSFGGSRPASTSAAPPRPQSNVPAPAPAAAQPPTVIVAQRQPGMIANIASTAAGVAIGHTVGSAMTSALGIGGGHQPAAAAEQPQEAVAQPQYVNQQQGSAPCAFELDQFIRCTQQNDLQVCYGFNEALKECRARYGVQSPQGF